MIAILDNIRSGHNVGSIFRTADAAGITKLYLCGVTAAPIDEFKQPKLQVTKVSLGSEKYVAWEYKKQASSLIDRLKNEGYKIFAVEQDSRSIPYFDFKMKKDELTKTAIAAGNEVSGLSEQILKRADKIIEIPMSGSKESLNVSVAFGIIAFYLRDTAQ